MSNVQKNNDSVILEEEIDPNYIPEEKEGCCYCHFFIITLDHWFSI
jgi:hypothetical protein